MFAAAGVDPSKIKYVDAGAPGWTTALAAGQGDACLAWEGVRAQLDAQGLNFDYWLGRFGSKLPSNSLVVRKADLDNPDRKEFIQEYLTAWTKGLEFADRNPRAAAQIVLEARPTLATSLGPTAGTRGLMQMHQIYKGTDFAKRPGGWGEHDLPQWDLFFTTAKKVGVTKNSITTKDWVLNEFIDKANGFDKKKVWSDADNYQLTADFKNVDVSVITAIDLGTVLNAS